MLIFFSNFFHLGQRPLDNCLVDLGKLITDCQTSSVEEEGEIKLPTFHYCSKDFTNISPSAQLFCFLALSVLFWSAVVHALQEHCRDCSSMGAQVLCLAMAMNLAGQRCIRWDYDPDKWVKANGRGVGA